VVVQRFDRMGRSVAHLLSVLDELRALGVAFVSLNESVDTSTPVGRMVFTLIGAVAEFEREIIRERVCAGVRRAQAEGKHCGRPRVAFDLRPATAMLDQGHGLKATATAMGVSPRTLRRRLREAGRWPRVTWVQNGGERSWYCRREPIPLAPVSPVGDRVLVAEDGSTAPYIPGTGKRGPPTCLLIRPLRSQPPRTRRRCGTRVGSPVGCVSANGVESCRSPATTTSPKRWPGWCARTQACQ